MKNTNLHKAKQNKNDEFYTRYEDIEIELSHYPAKYFKDKIIYLPCDVAIDGNKVPKSNFVKYFQINRVSLGYKKLIATSINNTKNLYILGQDGREFYGYCPEDSEYVSGDYRSAYCQKLFKEADVVVTNPPFSLFRDFVATLMNYDTKFLIIGNINCLSYKEIFPLIKDNKAWLGTGMGRWISGFIVPDNYELYGTETKVTESGQRIIATNNCLWLTNLDHAKRHEMLLLVKQYNETDFPKYDNYDAIEVSKTKNIPMDYNGIMGVPITFLDKYNPDQFEIIDMNPHFFAVVAQGLPKPKQLTLKSVGKKDPYARVLIRRKQQEVQ